MDRIIRSIALFVLCFFSVATLQSWADDQASYAKENSKNIVVEIDYGNVLPTRTVKTPWVKGKTVLEALQAVAEVKTHPVGQYVFVVSIDGVEGKRGEMAWYYTVDGKSADKLAFSNDLDINVRHVKWVYKKDACSGKVDKGI